MANKERREKFNLSFPTEMLVELRQIAHENTIKGRYTAVSELVEEAVLRWLGRGGGRNAPVVMPGPATEGGMAPEPSPHQGLIDKLVHILDSDSQDAIEAVTTNIEVFHRLVESDEHKKNPKKPKENNPGKLTG